MPDRDSTFCSCCTFGVDYQFVVLSVPRSPTPFTRAQLAHVNVLAKLRRAHDHDAARTTKRADTPRAPKVHTHS